jgi:hypothetical protein
MTELADAICIPPHNDDPCFLCIVVV